MVVQRWRVTAPLVVQASRPLNGRGPQLRPWDGRGHGGRGGPRGRRARYMGGGRAAFAPVGGSRRWTKASRQFDERWGIAVWGVAPV